MDEHRYTQAEAAISKLLKERPDDLALRLLYGDLLEKIGHFDEAETEYSRAAEIDASDPVPTVNLARISLKQLELERSLSYAQQSVARDPSYLPARLTYIEVLLACDQTAEAERQLKFIPEKEKNQPDVAILAYRLALKKGDYSGAHRYLMLARNAKSSGNGAQVETSSTPEKLSIEEADLLDTLGKYDAARKILEAIVENDPESFEAKLKLARFLELRYHDYEGALRQFEDALRMDPLSATAIAGKERCQSKRRNIALQIKIYLREIWGQLNSR